MYMNWAIVQLLSIGVLSKHKEDIIVYIVLTLYRSLDPWVYPPKYRLNLIHGQTESLRILSKGNSDPLG